MLTQVYEGIHSVERSLWDTVTCGYPYTGWDWCSYGETVLGTEGHYVIITEGEQPIAGAAFFVLHREQLPVKSRFMQRVLESYLERHPLLVCVTPPVTRHTALFLPAEQSKVEAALAAIRQSGTAIARQKRASFLLFDYLPASHLGLSWGECVTLSNFADPGTCMQIVWKTFDEYLADLRQRSKSAYKNYQRHMKKAAERGIVVRIESHLKNIDQALKLIRNIEQTYHLHPYPWARRVLEHATALPDSAYITAYIDDRLVSTELLLNDRENGVCCPVLYGRDYDIDYVYFCTYYEVIRYAIEELHARMLVGESGAYEFKNRLGFVQDSRNNLAFYSPSWFIQQLARRLA